MKLSIKCWNGNYSASLNHYYDLLWIQYECFYSHLIKIIHENHAKATSWDCIGATFHGLKCHEVPHIVQSATCKLQQMKNEFKYFGLLSVVISILIVLYDIEIFMLCISTGFLLWVCTRYSDSSRVTGTIGDTMWQELTFCFCECVIWFSFESYLCFWYSELLWICVILSGYVVLWNLWIMIYVLLKRRLANIFSIDRSCVLGMVLLTELTVHPSSLLFAD